MAYNIAPSKQDLLVSGTNIKTINSNNILGSGNLTIAGLPSSVAGDANKVLAVDNSGSAVWQYGGLGGGSLPSNTIVLGQNLPTGMTSTGTVLIGVGSGKASASGNNNTIVGSGSATALTSAASNTILGQGSGTTITTSPSNVLVGLNCQIGATSAGNNIVIGKDTGNSTSSGSSNVLIGGNAGLNLTSAGRTTSIGYQSGYSLTSGSNNTFLGMYAGYYCTTGSSNVLIGYQVLGSSSNSSSGLTNDTTAVGYQVLNTGTSSKSALLGNYILSSGGPATNSVILGFEASKTAPAVGNSVVAGYQAGYAINSASSNSTMLGYQAGYGVTSGTGNIFLGYTAGDAVTTGSNNVIIGDIAGTTTLADTIILAAGTAERVRIDSSGNMGIGTDSPATRLHAQQTSAATSTVTNILRVDSQSSGTPANGIGVGIEMAVETSSGNTEIGVVLEAVTTDVTSTSEDFDLVVKNMAAGATASETLRVASTGDVTAKTGNILIDTAGKGLTVKSGSNAKIGVTGAFPSGNPNTVQVANTSVTANSIILVSPMTFTGGITGAPFITAISAGASFDITVPDNSFTGTVGWVIVEKS